MASKKTTTGACSSESNDSASNDRASTFESALSELQDIVSRLEAGSISLEESMQEFERGVALLRQCYETLDKAEQRIEILTGFDREGRPLTKPFQAAATFGAEFNETRSTERAPKELF